MVSLVVRVGCSSGRTVRQIRQSGRRGGGGRLPTRTKDQMCGWNYCSSFRIACGAELAWASTEVAALVRIWACVMELTSVARSASVRFDRDAVTLVIAVCRFVVVYDSWFCVAPIVDRAVDTLPIAVSILARSAVALALV